MGLYVANERLGDLSVPLGLSTVADAIKRENPNAVVLMIDNEKLNSEECPYLPYLKPATSWSLSTTTKISVGDSTSASSVNETIRKLLEARRQELVGDFDDHLEDASIDWLTQSRLSTAL